MAAVAGAGSAGEKSPGSGELSLSGGILVPSPSTERGTPLRLAVSPDGSTVAYPALKLVVLRSLDDPTKATIFRGHIEQVRCVAFSRDGEWVASGDKSGVVQVWKASDPTVVRSKGPVSVDLRDVAFDPSGDHIVVCGDDKQKASLLNVDKLMTVCPSIMPMDKSALACDWSPAGDEAAGPSVAAWGGEDQRVFVYAKPPGKGFSQAKILSDADNSVNCVRFSPSGDRLATVSSDKGVRVYEVGSADGEGFTLIKQLGSSKVRHKGSVYTCSWSPDGKDLLTASADKSCKVWNMEDNKIRRTIPFGTTREHMVNGAAFAGPSRFVAVTLAGTLHIGNPAEKETPPAVAGHCAKVAAVAFDESSGKMFSVDTGGKVLLWTAAGDRERVAWTPAEVAGLAAHSKFVTCGDAAGGTWVTGSNDNELHVGSIETTERTGQVSLGRLPPRKAVVNPADSKVVACITMEEVILVREGEVAAREAVEEPVSMAFSASGEALFVGLKDGKAVRFDCAGGALAKTHEGEAAGRGDYPASLLELPTGALAVGTSGREVRLLDAGDLSTKLSKKWIVHSGSVKGLGYLHEEEAIVSACGSGMVCVWKEGADKAVATHRRPLGSSIEDATIVDGDAAWFLSDGVVQRLDLSLAE